MKSATSWVITVQFFAQSWSETPFQELPGAGKLSRASITNRLSGGLEGEGVLQYLLAYPPVEGGEVAFVGCERVIGHSGSRRGSFVLRHEGVFCKTTGVRGALQIVAGSATGDFAGLSGAGSLSAQAGAHGGVYALAAAMPA